MSISPSNSKHPEQQVPDPRHPIHWAVSQEEVDIARSRNLITDELVEFSQKHWHCSREEALNRLLAGTAH